MHTTIILQNFITMKKNKRKSSDIGPMKPVNGSGVQKNATRRKRCEK